MDAPFIMVLHLGGRAIAGSINKSEINLTSISYQFDIGVAMNWPMELNIRVCAKFFLKKTEGDFIIYVSGGRGQHSRVGARKTGVAV